MFIYSILINRDYLKNVFVKQKKNIKSHVGRKVGISHVYTINFYGSIKLIRPNLMNMDRLNKTFIEYWNENES